MNTTNQPAQPSYVDDYMPPSTDAVADQQVTSPQEPNNQDNNESPSENLEDQNIFTMLGVTEGTNEQREQFLDELQQVIWEDFLEYDVKLLITENENKELQTLMGDSKQLSLEQQEKIVEFLETLIPDLEAIMLEKALELKAEMFKERLASVKEIYAGNAERMEKVRESEELMNQNKWFSASNLLNSMQE